MKDDRQTWRQDTNNLTRREVGKKDTTTKSHITHTEIVGSHYLYICVSKYLNTQTHMQNLGYHCPIINTRNNGNDANTMAKWPEKR